MHLAPLRRYRVQERAEVNLVHTIWEVNRDSRALDDIHFCGKETRIVTTIGSVAG